MNQFVYVNPIKATFLFYLFVIPAIYIDILDMFFDTKYFNDLATGNILDHRIHIRY